MKKTLLILVGMFMITSTFAQSKKSDVQLDSILTDIAYRLKVIEYKMEPRFKLYKTENIYTFLKLDTATGQIDQFQWSLENNKDGTVGSINNEDLSLIVKEAGTFELYPTSNMYQFILLDKRLGRTWHVQWGIGDSKRWIKRVF